MKLTTTKLKKLIKEELSEMMHDQHRFDRSGMESVPNRQIPQIEKFKNLQMRLEREYGDHQPSVAAERFDYYDIDAMENLAYKLSSAQDSSGAVDDFIGFIRDVVNELND